MAEIKFDKDGKPIIKGDKIKDLPPHLQALIKQQQQLLKTKKAILRSLKWLRKI